MGRAGAPTPTKKKDKDVSASAEDKAGDLENKRLRDLAFSRGLLARTKSQPSHLLRPSQVIFKSDGRDIVKKGNRKNKYLFSFPGLMAPVAAGKLGELTNLDSKNPILYVDFPQGRLKLFGTIVYSKNKYLTLHFARGAGNIVCEDCFESLVVFSVAWWIGTKENNPEEVRLPWPKDFEQDKHADFDFTAGAGRAKDVDASGHQNEKHQRRAGMTLSNLETLHKPKSEVSESEGDGKDAEAQIASPPVRQSARTSGRKLKYAESSSEDEEDKDDGTSLWESQQNLKGASATVLLDSDGDTSKKKLAGLTASQINLLGELETTRTIVLEDSPPSKAPFVVSDSKVSKKVLKQSKIEAFSQKPALQEESPSVVHEFSTPRKNHKGSTDMLIESPKHVKRPRMSPYKDEREESGSEDQFSAEKVASSKGRKRIRNVKSNTANKGSAERSILTQSKAKKLKDEKVKQQLNQKAKKSTPGTTSRGKKSAGSKLSGGKPSTMGSDSEKELSDSDEGIDDSDEDWIG